MTAKRKYGWIPDRPDHRDHHYTFPVEQLHKLPSQIDLRAGCPPVYDQGQLGSCTANAIAAALQFDELKQKEASPFEPSRLFIYYNERVMEGTENSDAGAAIRDGIKSVGTTGYCSEDEWPYNIAHFAELPLATCYQDAKLYKALKYKRIGHAVPTMRACLASGSPFVFGFSVYESFEQVGSDGVVPMPGPDESLLGGHAVMCVGYDDNKQLFTVRNSWGQSWGDQGYCYMPYAYLSSLNLASDFWTIETVS
jgi:C1A family cysteine protease